MCKNNISNIVQGVAKLLILERLKTSRGIFSPKRDRGGQQKKVIGSHYILFTLHNEKPMNV